MTAWGDTLTAFSAAHLLACLAALGALGLALGVRAVFGGGRGSLPAAGLLLGLGAVSAAQLLASAGRFSLAGWAGKLLALGLVVCGGVWWNAGRRAAPGADGLRGSAPAETWRSPVLWGSLALVLAVALPIRLWELERYPRFFGGEHAWLSEAALNVLEGDSATTLGQLLRFPSGGYLRERLVPILVWTDLVALSIRVFGSSLSSIRLVSTLFGVLGITACLLVGWRFFDRRAALAGAFLMAVSPMWIAFSRDAHMLHYVLPYALCVLGAVLASLERPRVGTIVGTCVLCALALHLYQATYVAIPFVAVAWLVVAVRDPRWRAAAARGLAFGLPLACLVALLPLYYHWSERFAGEGYLPLNHLVRNAAAPVSATDGAERFVRSLASIWRHFASDGAPLHITAGVENYVQVGGTVHLPWVSSLFLVGLGACLVEARYRRTVRLLLFLTLLGVLPALLSETVLARRLQVFDACWFVIGGIGALAVGSALLAALGARSRYVVTVALAVAALALTATAWSSFRGLVERAEPDFDRELAETVSAGLEADEMAVMLFPSGEPRRTIQLLVWDRLPRRESARLLFWARDASELAALEPVPGRSFVRLSVREQSVWGNSPCSIAALRSEVARLGEPASRWTETSFGGPEHASLPAYLSLRIPIADFGLAKQLAMRCAVAPSEPR
jgi:hypothetical protein